MVRHAVLLLLAVGLTLSSAAATRAQAPETADPALLPHYVRVSPGLAAAGQPSPEAVRQLKALGFKTVINLRTPAEAGQEGEEEAVRAQGLAYVRVPVTPATFSPKDVDDVARVLDDPAAGPVLLHCASANRVGGVWAAIQARKGRSLEEAVDEGRKAGLKGAAMVEAVERVVGEAKPK